MNPHGLFSTLITIDCYLRLSVTANVSYLTVDKYVSVVLLNVSVNRSHIGSFAKDITVDNLT